MSIIESDASSMPVLVVAQSAASWAAAPGSFWPCTPS
jgi:hypothetical protein